MNLKSYALGYCKPELVWTDGKLLQLTHDVSDDALIKLSLAIILNGQLKDRFSYRENSICPESWDSLIEETSSELAEALAKLEAV